MTQHTETREYGIFMGSDIYKNYDPRESIIEGILNAGDNLVISSKPGTGKSILALQLICSLTTGKDFLDTFPVTRKYRVLYVQTEGDRAETILRLGHMQKGIPIDDNYWVHYNAVGITLNTEEGLNNFLSEILPIAIKFDVIIIDPLYATVKGTLNADDVATDWQRSMRIVRKKLQTKLTVIVFHHETTKTQRDNQGNTHLKSNDDLMGSTMWPAWMSSNYKMVKQEDSGIIVLQGGKGGGRGRSGQGVSEIHLRLIEPSPLYFVIDDSNLNETEMKVLSLLQTSPNGKLRRLQIEEKTEKSKPTVCRALATLIKTNKIHKIIEEGFVYYAPASK